MQSDFNFTHFIRDLVSRSQIEEVVNLLFQNLEQYFGIGSLILCRKYGDRYVMEYSFPEGITTDGFNLPTEVPDRFIALDEETEKYPEMKSFMERKRIRYYYPIRGGNQGEINSILLVGGKKNEPETSADPDSEPVRILLALTELALSKLFLSSQVKTYRRAFDQKVHKIQTIFEISDEFNRMIEETKIVNLLINSILGQFMISRCVVVLKKGRRWKLSQQRGIDGELLREEIIKRKKIFAVLNKLDGALRIHTSKAEGMGFLSQNGFSLVIPMIFQGKPLGAIILGSRFDDSELLNEDTEMIQMIANQAISAIQKSRFIQEIMKKREIEQELRVARDIQSRLLPGSFPDIAGYDIYGVNYPSKQVGGDYFDVITLDNGRLAIGLADVCGKGIPAALLMANLQASLRALLLELRPSVHTVVQKLNEIICENTEQDRFVTFFFGIIDTDKGEMIYTSAGHNPALYSDPAGTFYEFESLGPVLGVFPDIEYAEMKVPVEPGGTLVIFSDGITEATDKNGEEYGEQRLRRQIERTTGNSAKRMVEQIIRDVNAFADTSQQQDDITLLIIKSRHS